MDVLSNDFKLEFKAICRMLQSYDEGYSYLNNKEFNDIRNFITLDFLKLIEKELQFNWIEFINRFEKELDKFYMYGACNCLAKKNLIGIGGALNSGKSSFLNKLFSRNILPSMITPSISVPTYVTQNENVKISLLNIFDNIIDVSEDEMKSIYYEFEDTYNIPVSNILKNIFIQIPEQKYSNLAFLDTAGYNHLFRKDDCNNKSDYESMKDQLNSCNYILWFVDSECGTIKKSDIDFFEDLKKDIPILIIISRADKKQSDDIEKIENEVRIKLKKKGLPVLDIIPYSSKNSDMYSINKIEEYLEKWNENYVKNSIAKKIQLFFNELEDYFYEKIKEEKINLSNINSLLLNAEQLEDVKKLELIKEQITYKMDRIRRSENELKRLNIEFLSLLKKAAEKVGIDIYESLTESQNGGISKIINQYKKDNNIKDENYKGLINVRLYYSTNEIFENSGLFSNNSNSIIYKEIINKKLNYINKINMFNDKKSMKNIIEVFSEVSLKLEKKENNTKKLIKNQIKNLKNKNIEWIKIKEI